MKKDYEGAMVKSTLRKLIVFSQEILPLVEDEQQLPAWLQDKFSTLDHSIDVIYSYMKFAEFEKQSAPLELRVEE